MSKINIQTKSSLALNNSAGGVHERWRLIKDSVGRYGIVVGGLGVIFAIAVIFLYLLYVVYPLFISATAQAVNQYSVPDSSKGKTLFLGIEEQNEVGVRYTDNGEVIFFSVQTGKTILNQSIKIPEGAKIVSFSQGSPVSEGAVVYGLSNGKAVIVKHQYKITYPDNVRLITPSIDYPMGEEPIVVNESGAALDKIAVIIGEKTSAIVAKTADKIHLSSFEKEKSLFADEAKLTRTDTVLDYSALDVADILIDKEGRNLYLLNKNGQLGLFDIADKSSPTLIYEQNVIEAGQAVTSSAFLNGDLSLLIGDSNGLVSQWSKVRDKLNHFAMQKIRVFKVSDKAVLAINPEQRRKGFMTVDASGDVGVYHTTSEREMIKERVVDSAPVAAAISPRANALLVEAENGKISFWTLDNKHPEVSIRSLWQEVWYESYPKPDYVWQSSSANSDFEPKYSLTPLVFGTLKAAFYAMLVAMPLALMGAIYTAYFMTSKIRQYVKPSIELMGALPTVILGFLAGLWLAPIIEEYLAGLFALIIIVPLCVIAFAFAWQFLPKSTLQKIPEGWESAILIPVIILSAWFAFTVSVPLEAFLFNGTLRDWFKTELGIGYDQRNDPVCK